MQRRPDAGGMNVRGQYYLDRHPPPSPTLLPRCHQFCHRYTKPLTCWSNRIVLVAIKNRPNQTRHAHTLLSLYQVFWAVCRDIVKREQHGAGFLRTSSHHLTQTDNLYLFFSTKFSHDFPMTNAYISMEKSANAEGMDLYTRRG